MLQKIRDRISGWVSIVVIALVGGAFVLFGVEYYFEQGSGAQNDAAKVNGVVITHQMVDHTYSMMQKQIQSETGKPYNDAMAEQLKTYALQSIVTQTALFTTLSKEGFEVGLPQIKALVMQSPVFQDQGQFSDQKFMQLLTQMGETPFSFFQRVQSQWVVNQVVQGVSLSGFALPNEVKHWYAVAHQQRAFGYLVVPMHLFVSKINITDAAIKNYYKANQAQYQTPEKVSVAYILLSPAAIAKKVTVTPADVKNYYETHVSNFTMPARFVVSQITVPVAANASPADVKKAKAMADKVAARLLRHEAAGVDSATVTLSAANMPPELLTILSQLKLNQVSAPLRTQNGFTLLTLLKKEPATTSPFEKVQKQVMTLLQHQRVAKILAEQAGQLSNLTYTDPSSLASASAALHAPIQVSPMMSSEGIKGNSIFSSPNVLAAIFSESVLQSGNNSNVISLPDGSQLVLRVQKKEPSTAIALATVKDKIKQILTDEQASAQAGVLAYQLQQKIAAGESPLELAKKYNVQWHAVPLMMASQKTAVPAAVVAGAFSAAKPLQKNVLAVQTVPLNQHDYAVIAVTQVKNADASAMSASVAQKVNANLAALWGQLLQHGFISSVMQQSKITISK